MRFAVNSQEVFLAQDFSYKGSQLF